MAQVTTDSIFDHTYYWKSSKPTPKTTTTSMEELPDYVKSCKQLLSSIGFMSVNDNVYNQLRSLYPIISAEVLNKRERQLANRYKCDFYHHGCFFTTDETDLFRSHLEDEHSNQSLYCFYCSQSNHGDNCSTSSHSLYGHSTELVEHINVEHGNLRFQCNQCFYRGFSTDHVFIHQAIEHLNAFEETLKRKILDKKDEMNELSLIEKHYLLQFNDTINGESKSDDDTEVEDNCDEDKVAVAASTGKQTEHLCNILVCDSSERQDETLSYFSRFGLKLEYPNLDKYDGGSSLIHCAYCMADSKNGSPIEDIWVHCVLLHPAFPILAYDLSLVKKSLDSNGVTMDIKTKMKKFAQHTGSSNNGSLNLENVDESLIDNIIYTFRQQLANNSLPSSYDSGLMKKAFEVYERDAGVEQVTSTQGLKRKHDEELEKEAVQEPVVSESTEDQAVAEEEEETLPPPKRLRTSLVNMIPFSVRNRTKTLASMAATAVLAFGFYHLTNLLPESIN